MEANHDQKILKAMQAGHESLALRFLMEAYQERLYWQIRRMVVKHDLADDILQNTFIKVWKGLAKFRGDAKLSTWLHRIAYNETITALKKENKHKNVSIENSGDDSLNLAEQIAGDSYFDGDKTEEMLASAIAGLPEKQRIVFVMRYYEEKRYEEMSEILETSVGALKASYHHAVKKIERFLQEH